MKEIAQPTVRPLFIAGPSRSGTTALVDYLNQHEQVLVCKERYKYVCDEVRPEWLTFEYISDYEPGQGRKSGAQTNVAREYHADLVAGKDAAKLRWIGDKYPNYVRYLETLWRDNPGAKFIFTYRPIEEVAESHEARSKNPDDPWLGGKDGFEIGIKQWNDALRRTRDFIESTMHPSALIVSYNDFFYTNEEWIPLLSNFLGIEFGHSTREAWREISQSFESGRRSKESLSHRQTAMIAERKDHDAERWILDRISRQKVNPVLSDRTEGRTDVARSASPSEMTAAAREVLAESREQAREAESMKRAIEVKREELQSERQRSMLMEQDTLRSSARADGLESQMKAIQASRVWRVLTGFGALRTRLKRKT